MSRVGSSHFIICDQPLKMARAPCAPYLKYMAGSVGTFWKCAIKNVIGIIQNSYDGSACHGTSGKEECGLVCKNAFSVHIDRKPAYPGQ